jgi:hypothetical protein
MLVLLTYPTSLEIWMWYLITWLLNKHEQLEYYHYRQISFYEGWQKYRFVK